MSNVSVLVDNDFFGANGYAVEGHWLKNFIPLTIDRDVHDLCAIYRNWSILVVEPTDPRVMD